MMRSAGISQNLFSENEFFKVYQKRPQGKKTEKVLNTTPSPFGDLQGSFENSYIKET